MNIVRTANCNSVTVLQVSQLPKRELNEMMERIWDLDSIGIRADEAENRECNPVVEEFEKSIVFEHGRYMVALPWKTEASIGDNKRIAEKRLSQVTKRLMKSPELMKKYDDAIREYLISGVAEKVNEGVNEGMVHGHVYYMPHHAMIREDRMTTKIRIVFDASSHEDHSRIR
ncbi:uncharacterized protein LOC135392413 [Ornithodoros turicata]|uniref:uncharacterized protein LOC135392413 n=1 Tax=Ornithodoros turicata TaxID=34597 RepID=UPI0031393A08